MRKVVATEYVTLDGVMEDPGGGEGSPTGGWSFAYWNEEAAKFKLEELLAADALLLGRVTYQGFAAAWPAMTDEAGFADRMNGLPKYVASTTLATAAWNNSKLITADIAAEVAKLKQQSGQDILLAGSASLVQLLMAHDLIDELRLMVHPIVLGSGKRLFGEESGKKALKLIESKPFSSGVVVLTYAPENAV